MTERPNTTSRGALGFINSPFMDQVRSLVNPGLAAAAILGGVLAVSKLASALGPSNVNPRVEALQSVDTMSGGRLILRSGALVRSTPYTLDADDAGNTSNVVPLNIPKGEELVVRRPLFSSTEHLGWMAILVPGVKTSKISDVRTRAKDTVWANVSVLEQKGYAWESDPSVTTTYDASIDEGGNVQFNNPADDNTATDPTADTSYFRKAR